jgi:hypothetical protein
MTRSLSARETVSALTLGVSTMTPRARQSGRHQSRVVAPRTLVRFDSASSTESPRSRYFGNPRCRKVRGHRHDEFIRVHAIGFRQPAGRFNQSRHWGRIQSRAQRKAARARRSFPQLQASNASSQKQPGVGPSESSRNPRPALDKILGSAKDPAMSSPDNTSLTLRSSAAT